jgi:integrase/recombinase XerD
MKDDMVKYKQAKVGSREPTYSTSRGVACFFNSREKKYQSGGIIMHPSTQSAGERLLTHTLDTIYQIYPQIDFKLLQSKLSTVISQYDIRRIEKHISHPDLQEKIGLFLSSKKLEGLSSLSLDSYKLELRIFAHHVAKKVEEITTADIRVFLSKFTHLKLSSLSKKLSVLKSFFGWLTAEEIIQRDPTMKIKPPKLEKRLPKALTVEELEMLREGCQTIRQRTFIEVFYATGCRLSEIYELNRNDINWHAGSTKVLGKGSKEREVYLSFKAMYHLKKYLNIRTDNEPALFITERQPYRRLSKRGIQREIGLIAKAAGIHKEVSPHTLRHTFATLTLNNGAELAAVQELLGHSDPGTTQGYARISPERKKEQHKKFLVQ